MRFTEKKRIGLKVYGKEMMNYALNALKSMNCNEVILWVLKQNGGARRFYEKCGFVFDGTEKESTLGKILTEIRYVCF